VNQFKPAKIIQSKVFNKRKPIVLFLSNLISVSQCPAGGAVRHGVVFLYFLLFTAVIACQIQH